MRIKPDCCGDALPTISAWHGGSIEALESRALLSATFVAHPHLTPSHLLNGDQFTGLSPAQVRHAYEFDGFANGASANAGAGQTIAIVTAFDNPNIRADLQAFDEKFALPAIQSFLKVSQTGTDVLPVAHPHWASETALDVEWAHAMAPAANILLVEANSDSVDDLLTAVDYARHQAGVSVVSMSWGRAEFSGQTLYDPIFTTPASHAGVTFVASSGDGGLHGGVQWPASSPNVLSVGGTHLHLNLHGDWKGETAWAGSGGGVSAFETAPEYQSAATNNAQRVVPDVSIVADTSCGVQMYDSQTGGWMVAGGTSAGAPQWAGLIAIANQSRGDSNLAALDGRTQTLPALYDGYGNSASGNPTGGTPAGDQNAYTIKFHDVTASNGGDTGYDQSTGLGTPKATAVVARLKTESSTAPGVIDNALTPAELQKLKDQRKKQRFKPHAIHKPSPPSVPTSTTPPPATVTPEVIVAQPQAATPIPATNGVDLAAFGVVAARFDASVDRSGVPELDARSLEPGNVATPLGLASIQTFSFPVTPVSLSGLQRSKGFNQFDSPRTAIDVFGPTLVNDLARPVPSINRRTSASRHRPGWLTDLPPAEYQFQDVELFANARVLALGMAGVVTAYGVCLTVIRQRRKSRDAERVEVFSLLRWQPA